MSRDNVVTVRLAEDESEAARSAAAALALPPAAWIRMLLAQALQGGAVSVPKGAETGAVARPAELPIRLGDAELRALRAGATRAGVDVSTFLRALVARALSKQRRRA